jgi:excisionase family DNA binding protein
MRTVLTKALNGSGNHRPAVMLDKQMSLTRKQAAVLSGLPFSLIIAATKAGVLPAVKLGAGWRVKRSELERWADEFTG